MIKSFQNQDDFVPILAKKREKSDRIALYTLELSRFRLKARTIRVRDVRSENETMKGENEMPVAGMCPYFLYEKKGITHCECGELKFPDRRARRDIVYAYCAHPEDYKRCPFKGALDGYYERRYQ